MNPLTLNPPPEGNTTPRGYRLGGRRPTRPKAVTRDPTPATRDPLPVPATRDPNPKYRELFDTQEREKEKKWDVLKRKWLKKRASWEVY
ncbi:hypothetical protein DL98DRAFT_593068 [Cadophora sp. DSE1049]|nr:hypothetical protein DL98DRAFT_593068 [Cadophora sp. DSE1049]